MKFNYLYLIIYSLLIKINSETTPRYLQSIYDDEFQEGVYLIKNLEGHLSLKLIDNKLYFSSQGNNNTSNKFRIYKKQQKKFVEYESYNEEEQIYYYIEEKDLKKKLYFDESTESILASEKINPEDDDKFLWEIKFTKYRNNLNYFEIKTKSQNNYLSYDESNKELTKAYCENSWTSLSENRSPKIKLIKLYKENKNIKSDILEKEPIDVVIKYIDLNDTSLDRNDFDQINKDKQNNELKYSLRSVLKNIPWVRKIYIIMPNEHIPYLKEKEEIKDKIIYIKDNDLLGFDSSSPPSFQFNLHKLKKYGLSENFILMDDDYFIAQPLSKSDLFYEEKGKVFPYLISTEYSELDEDELKTQYMNGLSNINDINYHSKDGFLFRKISTLYFLFKIFDKRTDMNPLIEVGFTHNAIPLKISDVEEVYDNIEEHYQYNDICLRGNKRNIRSLQPQILFMSYVRNKYDRPVNEISWKYYDLSDVRQINLESKLFVINVEDKEYYPLRYQTEQEVLSGLFPHPTKYEKEYVKDTNVGSKKNDDALSYLTEIFYKIQSMNQNKKTEEKKDEKILDTLDTKESQQKEQKEEIKEQKKEEKQSDNNITSSISETKTIPINDNIMTNTVAKEENKDSSNQKLIKEISEEMEVQKHNYDKKYNELLEEISKIKTSISKTPQDNSLLIKKFEEFDRAQNEINKKLSSLEKDNTNIRQSQVQIAENLSKINKEKNSEEDSLKQLYNNLNNQNERIQNKLNKLSDDNYSLRNKINELNNKNENKDEKIKDIIDENNEMKKKIRSYENEIEEYKKKLENMENSQRVINNKNEMNEEQIKRLNYEIAQLKENLNKLNEKNEEKKNFFDESSIYNIKYALCFIIIIIVIYFVYKKCFKSDDDSSQNVRPMKLSQQYSGYSGFSNNLM